jgi:predicted DNA-binding transcriptional regulator YafY
MSKEYDKISTRLAFILRKFNNGDKFTAQELANEFNVNIRTIQRDLNERLEWLPIKKEKDYYSLEFYALGKLTYQDIENFANISGIKSLYPKLTKNFIVDILNNKINKAFLVKSRSFENIDIKTEDFQKLSLSIIDNKQINCNYNDKNRTLNPYKLVNNNGIWYLVASENDKLKTYTFSKIKNFIFSKNVFEPNSEFISMINNNKLNWFSQDEIIVTLEIDNNIAEYFIRREILANQTIIEHTDKKLILSTKVSYENEILSVVKYWLPHIKIQSPLNLQQKLENILQEYLKTT